MTKSALTYALTMFFAKYGIRIEDMPDQPILDCLVTNRKELLELILAESDDIETVGHSTVLPTDEYELLQDTIEDLQQEILKLETEA